MLWISYLFLCIGDQLLALLYRPAKNSSKEGHGIGVNVVGQEFSLDYAHLFEFPAFGPLDFDGAEISHRSLLEYMRPLWAAQNQRYNVPGRLGPNVELVKSLK